MARFLTALSRIAQLVLIISLSVYQDLHALKINEIFKRGDYYSLGPFTAADELMSFGLARVISAFGNFWDILNKVDTKVEFPSELTRRK